MKISLNWLQDFITFKETDTEVIRHRITFSTAEIEGIEEQGTMLKNILLGKITKMEPHPNADKLKLVTVDYGKDKKTIVCGGSNLREGMKIAFAEVGTVVELGGKGNPLIKLAPIKIRGVESAGMICASTEIGLGEMFPVKQEKEVVDLSQYEAALGTTLDKVLGLSDTILDIGNHAITHRGDLFSHKGIAREFVATGLAKWKNLPTPPSDPQFEPPSEPLSEPQPGSPSPIKVHIDDKSTCSRYCAVYLTGIEIKASPEWMQKRLMAIGIRPINNIVDVTNYVMMELGMPLHAFDKEQLTGKNHVLRMSKKGEKVVTLDQHEYELPENVVVLADEKEIYDLCGIMGGYQSGIKPETSKIWLHAPAFNGTYVRRAARILAQHSEASNIFEKGVSNEVAMEALLRATQLILELSPGSRVSSELVDIKNYREEKRQISLSSLEIERLLGIKISLKDARQILEDLGFGVTEEKTGKQKGIKVTVPVWRLKDVHLKADVIEEIGRIYGYDKIPMTLPMIEAKPYPKNPMRVLARNTKDFLCAQGFNELCSFSFLGKELMEKADLHANEQTITVANPLSGDMAIMRQSLLPRMLETIAANLRYRESFRLFELTRTHFRKSDTEVYEPQNLIVTTAGEDYRILQGVIEALLHHLGYQGIEFSNEKNPHPGMHPGRSGVIQVQGRKIGDLYQLHPKIMTAFDLKNKVVIAEIDFELLKSLPGSRAKYVELDRFPAVILDVSILIPRHSIALDYKKKIAHTDKTLIKKIELKDEYMGRGIPEDKRSITYSITYRLADRTLTEEEVNKVHQQVLENLKKAGAEIR